MLALFLLLLGLAQGHVLEYESFQSHDEDCYTQGLFFINSTHLFETCGLYNNSHFRILEYQAEPFAINTVYVSEIPWKRNIFLEGAIIFKGFLYMLTWREYTVYKMNPDTFEVLEEIPWKKDGWGLTHNTTHMFTTDGSNLVYLLD